MEIKREVKELFFYENGNRKLNGKKSFQNNGLDREREWEREKIFSLPHYLMS